VVSNEKAGYNRFLLLVAGLGGLLYGVDVGIIAGALRHLEATFKDVATGQALNVGQSRVPAADASSDDRLPRCECRFAPQEGGLLPRGL